MNTSILVIDDEINDSSISYQKSSLNNSFNYKTSLENLYQIFNNNADGIFSCDTSDCLCFIDDAGIEMPLHDFDIAKDRPVFLKIFNADLLKDGNEILIALEKNFCMTPKDLPWTFNIFYRYSMSIDFNCIAAVKDANVYYNGYNSCQHVANINGHNDIGNFPAMEYCNKQNIRLCNHVYQGYLPSSGQLIFLYKYSSMINYIFKHYHFPIIDFDKRIFWSSTESMCSSGVWALCNKRLYDGFHVYKHLDVIPFFKQLI